MVVIPNGFVQSTYTWSGPTHSGEASVVLGWTKPEELDLTDIGLRLSTAVIDYIQPVQHEAFSIVGVSVVTETQRVDVPITPVEGNRTGDLAPPQVCALMSKSSLARGRHARGRTYWPGLLNDGDIYDDGTINPSWVGTLNDHITDWIQFIMVPGITPVILHHDTELPPTAVLSGVIQGKVATQRRRLR